MAGTSNPRNGSTAWTSSAPCPRCRRFMNTNGDDYWCVHCGYSLEEKIERFHRRGKQWSCPQKRESSQRQREEEN